QAAHVQRLSTNSIAGYQLVNDIYGRALIIARVQAPRDIFQQANQTLYIYLIVIMLVTLMAMVVTLHTTNLIARQDRTIALKNEFFSIASHELRTPLGAIRGNSELIRQLYGPKKDPRLYDM